jgi:methionyl aminopeptidase
MTPSFKDYLDYFYNFALLMDSSLDIVVFYNGYVGDNAYTMPVGSVAPAVEKLLRVSKEALDLGIKQARVGNRIGDISHAIQTHCEASRLSVVREMVGHGVGVAMHEPPEIANFGRRGSGDKIKAGMTLAIEPMVNLGKPQVKLLADGWTAVTRDKSLSAQCEHSIGVTEDGYEVFTASPAGLFRPA